MEKHLHLKTFKDLRKFHGWTQIDLAQMVGVTQAAISQFEKGQSIPSMESFGRLAKCMKVHPLVLLRIFLPDISEKEYLLGIEHGAGRIQGECEILQAQLTTKDQEIERLKGAIEAFKKFASHRPGQEVEFFRFLANRDKGLKQRSADDAIWDAVADAIEALEDFPCSS